MRNTIILSAILFIAVIAASIYYFKNLDNNHSQSARPLRFLPENTLMIAAISNGQDTKDVFKDFEVLDAFIGFDNARLWSDFKTRILNNDKLNSFVGQSDIYISFHPEKKDIIPLFTIPTSQAIPSTELIGVINELSKTFKATTIDTLGQKIYRINYGQKDSVLHAVYFQDILFASPSIPLLAKVTEKHSKHLSDDQIEFFLKDHPRKTPLSIYFPHQQYDSIINLTQRNDNGPFINMFKKLHGQSAWNINFKKDALILTGESKMDQYPENYASIFKNQQKAEQNLHQYFPSNTAIYAEFTVSNRPTFKKDLHSLFKRRNEKIAESIDTTKATKILNKALGDQFALIETNAQNNIGFVNIQDNAAFKELEKFVLESTSDSIGRFSKSGTLYQQYGDVFKDFTRPYFTVIDSIMIVANHAQTLRTYRKNYLENDLLVGTLGYIKLESIQSKEANITVFAHARNSNNKFINALNQPFRDNFKNKDDFGYQDFFSWSIQLSGNNGNISSQIYAIYKSENTLGGAAEWNFPLENKAITKPYVFNQSDTSQFILIQELDHSIHAISPSGKKIWSKVFAGRVVGDIQQLEDRTILFITDKNNLYRIDTTGKSLSGFPKNISNKLIGTPYLTTIRGQKAILIPTENSIGAYDLEGKELSNWTKFETEGRISTSILAHDNKFIIGTSTGQIYWLNEHGQKTDSKKINDRVIALQTMAGYKIVALDNKGGVHLIATDNKQQKWSIPVDSARYSAAFANIINTNNSNFAVINNNKLELFDIKDTLSTVFNYNFTKTIDHEIEFFVNESNKNTSLIGIASKATNLLYLFDEKGLLIDGFPVEGQPLFYYGKINYNSATYLLCMRRDNKLYAFRQQN